MDNEQLSFDADFRRYWRKCVLFAKSYCYDEMDAENVASEAMLVYWKKRREGADIPYALPFLFGVIRNKILHLFRSRASMTAMQGNLESDAAMELRFRIDTLEGCDPHSLYNADIRRIISESIAKMGEQTGRAFMLSRFDGMTYNEIAMELGISEKTVEYHISKALKILRSELGDYLPLVAILFGL